MNIMKKLIVALLVLATVLTFAACTDEKKDNDDNDKTESTQSEVSTETSNEESTETSDETSTETSTENSDALAVTDSIIGTWKGEFNAIDMMAGEMEGMDIDITELPMSMTLEFTETELTMTLVADTESWTAFYTAVFTEMYNMYIDSGMLPEGTSFDDFMAQIGSIDELIEMMNTEETSEYTFENGKLIIDGEDGGVDIEIDGSTMTLTAVDEEAQGSFPVDSIEFTKVA